MPGCIDELSESLSSVISMLFSLLARSITMLSSAPEATSDIAVTWKPADRKARMTPKAQLSSARSAKSFRGRPFAKVESQNFLVGDSIRGIPKGCLDVFFL